MTDAPDGRPSQGALLNADLRQAAQRRAKSRDLKPLARLWPFIRAHWGTAAAAGFFLLVSTSATLGMTAAARLVVNQGFARGGSTQAINFYFAIPGGVALLLAAATALRFYFVTQIGERVVADAGGVRAPRVSSIPVTVVGAAGLVSRQMKEMAETGYMFARPFVMDSSASEERLGLAPTPLVDGLARTVAWWRIEQRRQQSGRAA